MTPCDLCHAFPQFAQVHSGEHYRRDTISESHILAAYGFPSMRKLVTVLHQAADSQTELKKTHKRRVRNAEQGMCGRHPAQVGRFESARKKVSRLFEQTSQSSRKVVCIYMLYLYDRIDGQCNALHSPHLHCPLRRSLMRGDFPNVEAGLAELLGFSRRL